MSDAETHSLHKQARPEDKGNVIIINLTEREGDDTQNLSNYTFSIQIYASMHIYINTKGTTELSCNDYLKILIFPLKFKW